MRKKGRGDKDEERASEEQTKKKKTPLRVQTWFAWYTAAKVIEKTRLRQLNVYV